MACPSVAISTKPTLTRFIYYKLFTLVPVSAAITAVVRHADSWVRPVLYVATCLTHAAVMNAAKCPHCPCHKKGDRTFECSIWRSTPKPWRNREVPEAARVGKYAAFGNECTRCLNSDCGHCGVPDDLRKEHLTTFG